MTGDLGAVADAAIERGDFTEATLSMLATLIEREPRAVGWRIAAERCLVALGRHDEAQRALDAARAIDPRSGVVASQQAKLDRLLRIRAHAQRLLAESPERLRAELGAARDNATEADFQVEGCRLLAALDPSDAGALCALGGAQRRAGEPRVALHTYRRAEALADLDQAEGTRSPSALAAAKRLLDVLWARDEHTPEVQRAYGRLHSLSERLAG